MSQGQGQGMGLRLPPHAWGGGAGGRGRGGHGKRQQWPSVDLWQGLEHQSYLQSFFPAVSYQRGELPLPATDDEWKALEMAERRRWAARTHTYHGLGADCACADVV